MLAEQLDKSPKLQDPSKCTIAPTFPSLACHVRLRLSQELQDPSIHGGNRDALLPIPLPRHASLAPRHPPPWELE
jgi:hypothetical protein